MGQTIEPIESSQQLTDKLNAELINLDTIIENPKLDHSRVLEQALKVLMLMSRLLGRADKQYVLENEKDVFVKVQELKGTYQSWSVLAITVVSGCLSIAGGCVGIGVAFAGSETVAKTLENISKGLGSAGQGTGAFSSLFKDEAESRRVVYQATLEEIKHKRGDRQDAAAKKAQQCDSTHQTVQQTIQQAHRAFQQVSSAAAA